MEYSILAKLHRLTNIVLSFSVEQIAQCREEKIGLAFRENKLIRAAGEWRRLLPKYSERKAKVTIEESPFYRGKGGILFANGSYRNLNFFAYPPPYIGYYCNTEFRTSLGRKAICYMDLPRAARFSLAFSFSLGKVSPSRHVYALILGLWPLDILTEKKSFHVMIELEETRFVTMKEFKSSTVSKVISHDSELLISNQIVVPFRYSVGIDKKAALHGRLRYKCDACHYRMALSHLQLVQIK